MSVWSHFEESDDDDPPIAPPNSWAVLPEESSSCSSGLEEARVSAPVGRRRRGRPSRFSPPARRPAQQQQLVSKAPWWHQIRPLGSSLMQSLALAVVVPAEGKLVAHDYQQVLDRCLGSKPRPCMPVSGEAEVLGVDRRRLGDKTKRIAALIHMGSRLFWASIVSHILCQVNAGLLVPIAIIIYCQYDETPLKAAMRKLTRLERLKRIGWRPALEGPLPTKRKRGAHQCGRAAVDVKIFQTELRVAFIVQNPKSKEVLNLHTELPCSLEAGDSNSGENVKAQLQSQKGLPLLRAAATTFPMVLHAATRDKGPGNLRAEKSDIVDNPLTLGQDCVVHCGNIV